MKKAFTLFAAVMLLATMSFAQGTARRGEKVQQTPAQTFKAQLKKQAAKASTKAAGDTISTFPWTEGFEAGTTGFTFVDSDNDGYNWEVVTVSGDNFSVNSGDACITSASYDNTDGPLTPDNWMILPVMEIPSSMSEVTLSWYEKAQDASYSDEYYSVYITTTGHAVSNFTATTAVYSGLATGSWVKRTVDLSSYAGQTIHIAFRHYNCTDMFYLNIDDIRIGGPEPPTITLAGPASSPNNVPVTFTAVASTSPIAWYVDGSLQSVTIDTMVYTFTTTGLHEVIAEVTNSVGSASDTLVIDVFSCDNITIPYAPNFDGGLGCWTSRSDSTAGSGWFASIDMFDANPEGQVLSMSAQSVWGLFMMDFPADNWLFSPEIAMPSTGSYELAWKVKPFTSDYDGDHYGVYVISGTDTNLLFEESLTGMTDYNQRMALIPSTVSGDFQVAFRHFNSVGGYVIILDSIQLRALTAPVVTLNGPNAVENGHAATFTATCGNATSFSWTINGIADTTTGNVLTTTFTTDGNYTIAVTATNSEGSSSANMTVEVYTCNAITSFPYSQDFESGIRCWNMVSMDPANDDLFGITEESENVYAGNAAFMFSSYSSASDYNQYLISPELVLPATGTYMVKFQYMGETENESFRIMASSTTNDINSFTEVADFAQTATDWTMAAAMLPAGTKYVAIDYYGNYQYYLYIDNLTISELNEAPTVTIAGPTSALADEQVTFVADAPLATSFSWTVDGTPVNETSNTLTTTFTTAGNHSVSVTATNSIGSNSATANITVISCDAINTFPWVANFESNGEYDCWKFIDADGDGFNWDPEQGTNDAGVGYGHNSNGAMFSASYINNYGALTPDNWMVLPAMDLPTGSDLKLSWYAKGQDPSYAAEYYSVYISTTGRNENDFTTQLFSETTTGDWQGHQVSLAAYAGQTVYIAFRHYNVTDMFYLVLDDIKIATEGVGIDEVSNTTLSLYPNPASTTVAVSAEGIEGNVTVSIVDLNGRVMMQQQGNAQHFTFDVNTLARGAYFVRMTGANFNAVRKLVVK